MGIFLAASDNHFFNESQEKNKKKPRWPTEPDFSTFCQVTNFPPDCQNVFLL